MPQHTSLARLLAARLCHDLGGAVSTLAGTLDLADPGDPSMLDIARESAQTLRARLRLYAAAWGISATELDGAGLEALLAAAPASPRVRFAAEQVAPGGSLPAALVPIALNAALLGAEALPRGGMVHLQGDATSGLLVWPEGASAAWPPALLGALSGQPLDRLLEEGPRRVLVPLLLEFAAEAGWQVSLGLGGPAAAGCAPLSVAPG